MRVSFSSARKSQGLDTTLQLTADIQDLAFTLLEEFNKKKVNLLDLPPYKRITLFFLTRALKTFSATSLLNQNGYTQDVSALIRSLLENLISLKYILRDPLSSDHKTARFVDYKWVILRRYVSGTASKAETDRIAKQVEAFKKSYSIQSDKALVTWSGKSIRDMAKAVDTGLLEEYDSTFRLCSRFAHPSIIGDKDFFTFENMTMTFSSAPTTDGNNTLIIKALLYLLDFLRITDTLFDLKCSAELAGVKARVQTAYSENDSLCRTDTQEQTKTVKKDAQKRIIVQFDISSRR